jgi:hypothetical protein
MADTVKILADLVLSVTVVLVGVASQNNSYRRA